MVHQGGGGDQAGGIGQTPVNAFFGTPVYGNRLPAFSACGVGLPLRENRGTPKSAVIVGKQLLHTLPVMMAGWSGAKAGTAPLWGVRAVSRFSGKKDRTKGSE